MGMSQAEPGPRPRVWAELLVEPGSRVVPLRAEPGPAPQKGAPEQEPRDLDPRGPLGLCGIPQGPLGTQQEP